MSACRGQIIRNNLLCHVYNCRCYAHLRKLQDRFTEIDVSDREAKDKMRSAPELDSSKLTSLLKSVPQNVEQALLEQDLK